jgi:hypothetical protein
MLEDKFINVIRILVQDVFKFAMSSFFLKSGLAPQLMNELFFP